MDHTSTHRKTHNLSSANFPELSRKQHQGAEQQNQRLPKVTVVEFDHWNAQILGETLALTPCSAAASGVSASGKWPKSDHIKEIFAFLLCGGQILFPSEVGHEEPTAPSTLPQQNKDTDVHCRLHNNFSGVSKGKETTYYSIPHTC